MLISQFSNKSEILSKSNLYFEILRYTEDCINFKPKNELITIYPKDLELILEKCKINIEDQASCLVRFVSNQLKNLQISRIYKKLNDPTWMLSAKICEIFRHPDISKNEGDIDTFALQEKIFNCLVQPTDLQLVIAWGQPKRMLGGLKTLGEFCDLAEIYAIAKLITIKYAVIKLAKRSVKFTILTGGDRFFEALFTRPSLTSTYDKQRQLIADFLDAQKNIEFISYLKLSQFSHNKSIESKETLNRFNKALSAVTNQMILSKFDTILLNIDWDHLLSTSSANRYENPHEIAIPSNVVKWLKNKNIVSCHNLIREAIIKIIIFQCQPKKIIGSVIDSDIVGEVIEFMKKVTWESTRKYIAIHLMDSHDEVSNILNIQGSNFLRLTVHKKSDQKTVPAIFTLTRSSGNQLSQHVVTHISKSGQPIFTSYAALLPKNALPVYLDPKSNWFLFGWLILARQPLCFIDTEMKKTYNPVDLICKAIATL